MYIFGLLLEFPVLFRWYMLVVTLSSNIDFAVLLSLLSCFLAPGTGDNMVNTVPSFGQIQRDICKGGGCAALQEEHLQLITYQGFARYD